jgi:hypothetical protein
MPAYRKFIAAVLGALATFLTTWGVTGDLVPALVTLGAAVLTAGAVWAVPNTLTLTQQAAIQRDLGIAANLRGIADGDA